MTDVAALAAQVREARSQVDRLAGEARVIAREGKAAEADVAAIRDQIELHEKVLGVLASLGETRQQSAQRQVEELVTRGLQTIFGEELSFCLVAGERAGQATTEFVIRSEYIAGDGAGQHCDAPVVVETPVMEARGGGMAVVVAFMLRLVVLLLTPGARRILFLDESFSHVSAEYEPRLAEFLAEVTAKAGVQIVMVTHSSAYTDLADARYRLAQGPDGTTEVTQA